MSVWEPKNWRQQLLNIQEMRKSTPAPVDTLGCDILRGDKDNAANCRFQTLVSLMLSSQTKDAMTDAAMAQLNSQFGGCFTVADIVCAKEEFLTTQIKNVCFAKTKAKNIKRTAEILERDYMSDIPESLEEILKLPGVGPKMGHLAMKCAWGKTTGIAVDTHVHRISNRLHWVRKPPLKNAESVRKELESWLPQEYWNEINHLFVGFGQTICNAKKPDCKSCLNKDICPSAVLVSNTKNTKPKQT